MIRKQVYLAREQDRKLKALATRRGCTEAEVIRDALDRLPDPDGDVEAQLAAAGLLVPKENDPDAPNGAAVRARGRNGSLAACPADQHRTLRGRLGGSLRNVTLTPPSR